LQYCRNTLRAYHYALTRGLVRQKSPIAHAIRALCFGRRTLKTVTVRVSPNERTYVGKHAEADGVDLTEFAKRAEQWFRETHGIPVLGKPRPLARQKRR